MPQKEIMIAVQNRNSRSARLFGNRVEPPITNRTAAAARRILDESPLFRGRSNLIRIDECDGQLLLEGKLPTFYLKQMLQTILRDVEGVSHIENRVAVDWP